MDELWPSLEAEAPRASLDMALSRLRKLLELPDAVRWVDGQLLLEAPWVWTDVAAFEARCEATEAGGAQAGTALTEALALYTAPLLGTQALTGMAQDLRQRLAQRHTRLVLRQCEAWLAQGRWAAAEQLFERGMQFDPLAEPLYRGLMAAQLQRAACQRHAVACTIEVRWRTAPNGCLADPYTPPGQRL